MIKNILTNTYLLIEQSLHLNENCNKCQIPDESTCTSLLLTKKASRGGMLAIIAKGFCCNCSNCQNNIQIILKKRSYMPLFMGGTFAYRLKNSFLESL